MPATVQPIRGRAPTTRAVPLKRSRFWIVCLFFFLWACAIAGRLFWLQIVDHRQYLERAARQQQRTFEVAPRRGILYDRNLRELAMTVLADSIYADPTEIADKRAAAHTLAALVHTDPEDQLTTEDEIAARLNAGHNFAWIARRVSPQAASAVRALNMKGIYFQKEFERFYPDNEIAAQVLGYVGVDDNGLGGLEEKFDSELHGQPGLMYMAMDARRKVLGSTEREPEPGRNMVLTIDENIQFMAERALDRAMEKTQALNGTVVVEDVHTGQILALAIRPTFNPNRFRHTTPALLRDHAVSDVYEPGSTFKLVTYSAAMDAKVVTPDDSIDCQGGKITIFGRTIHDNQGEHLGVIPVHRALEESSDVAAVKLAMKIGPDKFYRYIRDFGFGGRSGVELPGETRGLLRPVSRWQPSSIGSVAIGQEIAVTPLQLVAMVSTIANGGVYLPPHVLLPDQSGSTNLNQKPAPPQVAQVAQPVKPGEELPDPLPSGAHRVISTLAAAQMRKMMEGVVLFGTGRQAQLNGYSSGGKTGTAQKIDPATHTYSKTMHIGSFAGFAPVNSPVIAVAVIIDSAEGRLLRRRCGGAGLCRCGAAGSRIPRRSARHRSAADEQRIEKGAARSAKTMPRQRAKNVQALYDAANDLPSDDPLHAAANAPAAPAANAQAYPRRMCPPHPRRLRQATRRPARVPARVPGSGLRRPCSRLLGKRKLLRGPGREQSCHLRRRRTDRAHASSAYRSAK